MCGWSVCLYASRGSVSCAVSLLGSLVSTGGSLARHHDPFHVSYVCSCCDRRAVVPVAGLAVAYGSKRVASECCLHVVLVSVSVGSRVHQASLDNRRLARMTFALLYYARSFARTE